MNYRTDNHVRCGRCGKSVLEDEIERDAQGKATCRSCAPHVAVDEVLAAAHAGTSVRRRRYVIVGALSVVFAALVVYFGVIVPRKEKAARALDVQTRITTVLDLVRTNVAAFKGTDEVGCDEATRARAAGAEIDWVEGSTLRHERKGAGLWTSIASQRPQDLLSYEKDPSPGRSAWADRALRELLFKGFVLVFDARDHYDDKMGETWIGWVLVLDLTNAGKIVCAARMTVSREISIDESHLKRAASTGLRRIADEAIQVAP